MITTRTTLRSMTRRLNHPRGEYRVLAEYEYRVPSTEYQVPSIEYRVPSTESLPLSIVIPSGARNLLVTATPNQRRRRDRIQPGT